MPASATVLPFLDEAALLQAAARGDVRAFERLYRQYAPQVHGLCLRMTGDTQIAEDCTQECFIAAWRALAGFEGRSRIGTWLHRIAVNRVLNRRRGQPSEPALSLDAVEDEVMRLAVMAEDGGPIDVERAVARLPERARHVLVLVGIYGYSHEEAATLLGVAVGTCKAQLHRARALLGTQLGLDPA